MFCLYSFEAKSPVPMEENLAPGQVEDAPEQMAPSRTATFVDTRPSSAAKTSKVLPPDASEWNYCETINIWWRFKLG